VRFSRIRLLWVTCSVEHQLFVVRVDKGGLNDLHFIINSASLWQEAFPVVLGVYGSL